MGIRSANLFLLSVGIALAWGAAPIWAKYKARPWSMDARERYHASLTSEGVTIAVEPLYTDALAAQVFDKNDIVTRGIMPLAILIFNDNSFAIEVDGLSIELIYEDDHIRTLAPNEVVYRLYSKEKAWINQPIPRLSGSAFNKDALMDFDEKFLMDKTVAPHDKGGGFVYLHIPDSNDISAYLSKSVVYIPKVYRKDNGTRLIFFEIPLGAAVNSAPHN